MASHAWGAVESGSRAKSVVERTVSDARHQVSATGHGELYLFLNPDAMRLLGLTITGAKGATEVGGLRLPLVPANDALTVELADGAPTAIGHGALLVNGLKLQRRDGRFAPALKVAAGKSGLELNLQDGDGNIWLHIADAMRWPSIREGGFRLVTADLRAGPALAAFVGTDIEQLALANASLQIPLSLAGQPGSTDALTKTCAAPVWSGSPGTVTDVLLNTIGRVDVLRCRALVGEVGCDGPGGSEGEVVVVPSATLKNSSLPNVTDVPWFRMFSTAAEYGGIDQHPYLVWNMYRLEADGSIVQIARSGLKHAFATANTGCNDNSCVPYGNILGRSCGDIYNATSNDCDRFLGPRSEIIPSTGVWGRCGSIQDLNCDGATVPAIPAGFSCTPASDSPASDKYSYRMRARESDIDTLQHEDAQWLIDAWYVVRDDENIYNTMGSVEVVPDFATLGRWRMGSPGPFVTGAVIDRWLAQAGPEEHSLRSTADTPEGQIGVAVRVSRLPGQRFRYDYAVMNFDFARVQVDPMTSEPNLRIAASSGLSAVSVDVLNGAGVESSTVLDGDADAANDWLASAITGGWQWTAPGVADATMDWGQLRFFRVISMDYPGPGTMTFGVADAGSPASYGTAVLVPDASIRLFADDFE